MIANYARLLELTTYKNLNESMVQEADANPADALAKVKSGMNGGTYKNQWDQLVKEISAKVDSGSTSGFFMVKHDASIGGTDMVNVSWAVDSNGKVTLNASQAGSTVSAPENIKKAADKIFTALAGSAFNEDEEAVYAAFRDNISSDADLTSLFNYWKSQKVPYAEGKRGLKNFADGREFHKWAQSNPNRVEFGLDYWLTKLFNSSELNKLNDYLSQKNIKYRFKLS
jgi:hypothetical protein